MTARFVTASALAGIVTRRAARARRRSAQASDPELRPTRGPYITGAVRAGDADATARGAEPGPAGPVARRQLAAGRLSAGEGCGASRGAAPGFTGRRRSSAAARLGLALSRVAGGRRGRRRRAHQFSAALRAAPRARVRARRRLGAPVGRPVRRRRHLRPRPGVPASGRYVAFGAVLEDVPAADRRPAWCCRGCGSPSWRCARRAPTGSSWRSAPRTPKATHGAGWCRARGSVVTVTRGLRLYGDAQRAAARDALAFGGAATCRLGFGLALDLDHVGRCWGRRSSSRASGRDGVGVAARLHVSGERAAGLAAGPGVRGARSAWKASTTSASS